MITLKNVKKRNRLAVAAAFAGFMLVNGMSSSAYESIHVTDAPSAVAGVVYEQAAIYEEAVKSSAIELTDVPVENKTIGVDSEGASVNVSEEAAEEKTEETTEQKEEAAAEDKAEETTEQKEEGAAEVKTEETAEQKEETAAEVKTEETAAPKEEVKAEELSVNETAAEEAPETVKEEAEAEAEAAAQEPAGQVYEVPNYSGNKSYESYRVIRRGKAGTLQTMASTNSDGFRIVNGRYLIAVGTYFGASRGQYLDLTLENGTVIPCIVGDMKAAPIFSANGCCSEFIVDTAVIRNVISSGDVSDYRSEWDSPVDTITVYQEYAL